MENYNRKQIMDLSSFLLIEFSDDSEADLSPSIVAASVHEDNNTDDAQSSCNDSCGVGWDYSNPDHDGIELYNDDGYAFQDCTARVVERPWEEFYEEEEEEEGEVNMSGRRRHNNSKASCIHDDGSRDQQPAARSEMEKNKNFWETCLASGF